MDDAAGAISVKTGLIFGRLDDRSGRYELHDQRATLPAGDKI
jgi:hypothetical protein